MDANEHQFSTQDGRAAPRPALVLVAVSGSPGSARLVEAAAWLAAALGASWEAIHVETPEGRSGDDEAAAQALGLAARLGAAIATVPAASVADGIEFHLSQSPASHIVLGRSHIRGVSALWRRSVADLLVERDPGIALHLLPSAGEEARRRRVQPDTAKPSGLHYLYAILLVAAVLVVATLLQRATAMRGLDLLFLFPAILVSARFGLRPAVLAVFLSALSYNFFLLDPIHAFDPGRPETYVLFVVLLIISIYVGLLTSRLRGRLALSDRSAQENAGVAAFALRLTGLSDWEGTAMAVCEQVATMLDVNAMVYREVNGRLLVAGAVPAEVELGPLARAALDWAWSHGEPAGNGTDQLQAAEWRFQPLKTSLGTLAVLAIAKDDGSDPARPDRAVLFSTLVAQASLAHERLRLEDAHGRIAIGKR
jgi:two-component system sensor histidine kinase KdpD